jgi:hypothetical protein
MYNGCQFGKQCLRTYLVTNETSGINFTLGHVLSQGFHYLANLCLTLSHKSNFCLLVFVLSLFGAISVIGHCVKLALLLLLLLLLSATLKVSSECN